MSQPWSQSFCLEIRLATIDLIHFRVEFVRPQSSQAKEDEGLFRKSTLKSRKGKEVVHFNLGKCNIFNVAFFSILYSRKLSTMILNFGATEMPIILQEARLGLTHKRPKCQVTGTHPFPRFVLV